MCTACLYYFADLSLGTYFDLYRIYFWDATCGSIRTSAVVCFIMKSFWSRIAVANRAGIVCDFIAN